MKNNDAPVLEVRDLKQHFDIGTGRKHIFVKAVDGVSFSLKKGETLGLVGESGCGKTTTGRSIINLYNITDGEVILNGVKIAQGVASYVEELKRIKEEYKANVSEFKTKVKDENKTKITEIKEEYKAKVKDENKTKITEIKEEYKANVSELKTKIKDDKNKFNTKMSEIREINKIRVSELKTKIKDAKHLNNENKHYYDKIQMIFQDPIASLNPRMTVKEIIAEGLRIHGEKDEKVIKQKVADILQIVGLLPEHAFRYPHEFSGGQRQRIGVARALVIEPEILIADEPISALDVSIQAQVINLLNDLKHKFGLTVLFIAHDLSVVKYFSDRIAVMYYGKLVEVADSKELFLNPLHPYTKSLLSAIPIPDPIHERKRTRIHYDQSSHNYDENNQPSLVEIKPGHFISASPSELVEYKKVLK